MTFEEAMEDDAEVSKSQALAECTRHNLETCEMLAALGDRPVYKAKEVLLWLGY